LPSSVLSPHRVAPYRLALPPRPWAASSLNHEVFRRSTPPLRKRKGSSARRLYASPEQPHRDLRKAEAGSAHAMATFPARGHSASLPRPAAHSLSSASPEVSSPTAPSARRVLFSVRTVQAPPIRLRLCLGRSLAAFRVSHPLDGLLLVGPRRCVSPGKRSWGSIAPCPCSALRIRAFPLEVEETVVPDEPEEGRRAEAARRSRCSPGCFHPDPERGRRGRPNRR
jgi:hypothetical protein